MEFNTKYGVLVESSRVELIHHNESDSVKSLCVAVAPRRTMFESRLQFTQTQHRTHNTHWNGWTNKELVMELKKVSQHHRHRHRWNSHTLEIISSEYNSRRRRDVSQGDTVAWHNYIPHQQHYVPWHKHCRIPGDYKCCANGGLNQVNGCFCLVNSN